MIINNEHIIDILFNIMFYILKYKSVTHKKALIWEREKKLNNGKNRPISSRGIGSWLMLMHKS